MDRNYLYQVDIREWIENGLDAEIMVPVFGNRKGMTTNPATRPFRVFVGSELDVV